MPSRNFTKLPLLFSQMYSECCRAEPATMYSPSPEKQHFFHRDLTTCVTCLLSTSKWQKHSSFTWICDTNNVLLWLERCVDCFQIISTNLTLLSKLYDTLCQRWCLPYDGSKNYDKSTMSYWLNYWAILKMSLHWCQIKQFDNELLVKLLGYFKDVTALMSDKTVRQWVTG